MLYLRTGLPGASKTLNTVKEICEDSNYKNSEIYYHNIKLLLLDLDVCYSFEGFFYGEFFPNLPPEKKQKFQTTITRLHTTDQLASLEQFPFLEAQYNAYTQSDRPMELFLHWARKVYPKDKIKPFDDYLQLKGDEPLTKEILRTFNLDWRHFEDPTKWQELPNGSVIVIDECQDFFPPMSPTAKRPDYYTQFAKHRHKGVDVHLVTQNERFLDSMIRNLTHRHIHYFNKMGGKKVFRIEAPEAFDTKSKTDRNAQPFSVITRDKSFYGVYWSADIHTHKLRIPKVFVVAGLVVVVCGSIAAFLGYRFLNSVNDNAGLYTVESEADADSRSPVYVPENNQAQRVQTPNKEVQLYFEEQATQFEHPLAERCNKLQYAGFEKIRQRNGFKVSHYFSCTTSEIVTYNKYEQSQSDLPSDNAPETTAKQIETQSYVSKLVAMDMLEKLGYSLTFDGRFLLLGYENKQIIYERSP